MPGHPWTGTGSPLRLKRTEQDEAESRPHAASHP